MRCLPADIATVTTTEVCHLGAVAGWWPMPEDPMANFLRVVAELEVVSGV